LIVDSDPSSSLGELVSRLLASMGAARRRRLVGLFILMLFGAVAEMVSIGSIVPFLSLLGGGPNAPSPALAEEILNRIGGLTGSDHLTTAALLFIAAAVIAAAIRLTLSWTTQAFTLGLGHELAVGIQARILHQPYLFHVANHSSRILASLEKVQILSSAVLLQLMQAVSAIVIGTFIILAVASVDLTAAVFAAAILGGAYFLISRLASPRLVRDAAILGSAYDQRLKLVQESLGGIRDIIIDQCQSMHVDEFRAVDAQFARARLSSGFLVTAPRFLIEAAGMVLLAALAVYLSSEGQGAAAALPVLGALALGALRLLPLLQQLYQAWVSLAANRTIAAEVLSLLALPVSGDDPAPSPLPFECSIRFENLSFTYPGRDGLALKDVNLVIPRGSRIAVVGKTGSGKSTFVDLLMGLLAPTDGSIEVDGVRLDEQSRPAWQQNIAHVPQSIFLADASIARNIAIGGSPAALDMGRVAEAAKTAQLQEFIDDLPLGLDTRVGERGIGLSGGQRQRLALARAIYKNSAVLILDEATSALDDETEKAVLRILDELHHRGKTIVIVSHRQSALHDSDMVIRLDKGGIAS
jgi:ATP-binding cassette subfamily B protein